MLIPKHITERIEKEYPGAVLLHSKAKSCIWDSKKGTILKLTNCPGAIDWLATAHHRHKPHMPVVHRMIKLHHTSHYQIYLFEMETLYTFDEVEQDMGPQEHTTLGAYDGWLMELSHQLTICNRDWTAQNKKLTDKAFFKRFNPLMTLPPECASFRKEVKVLRTMLKRFKGNAYPDLTGSQQNIMFRSNATLVILDPVATISQEHPRTKYTLAQN